MSRFVFIAVLMLGCSVEEPLSDCLESCEWELLETEMQPTIDQVIECTACEVSCYEERDKKPGLVAAWDEYIECSSASAYACFYEFINDSPFQTDCMYDI